MTDPSDRRPDALAGLLPDLELDAPVDAQLDADLDAELDETRDLVTAPLAQLLAPPADLGSRTRDHAAATLMSRSLLGTLADLATVGWQTLRILVGDEEHEHDEQDRHREEER